jgi:hypothetical protein
MVSSNWLMVAIRKRMVYNSGVSRSIRAGTQSIHNSTHDLSDLPGRDGLGSANDSSSHHLASITDASAERQAPSLHRQHLQSNRFTAPRLTNHRSEVLPGVILDNAPPEAL